MACRKIGGEMVRIVQFGALREHRRLRERVLKPLGLGAGERRDLVAFLRALTGRQRQPAFENASVAR